MRIIVQSIYDSFDCAGSPLSHKHNSRYIVLFYIMAAWNNQWAEYGDTHYAIACIFAHDMIDF